MSTGALIAIFVVGAVVVGGVVYASTAHASPAGGAAIAGGGPITGTGRRGVSHFATPAAATAAITMGRNRF